ncbi:DNA-binding transcriptional LysR family regulator [Pseudomonas sp. JUb42]|jgi:DNA-binding transcriptional LysR family regulator|uniref:LysR family transcriptional regulator n=1 Tax=Pseudomonas sp. JUb42 TaxID=2940611 RepID=UPI002168893A|nr:LysR family transcriptional regulator [Pseudomonas sp. JUb42]MCS3467349.1 DNA-binding transcriptional LysR family regulator [Pseudomonas sp. JUb42]
MKFYQLNALVAVADAGSIRGAAKRLDTSPAAVTKAVQKLESEISLQLLVRNTSGIDFTEAGKRLLVQARLLVAQMDSATHVVADCKGELTGRLSVAVTPWLAMTLLPQVMVKFRQQFPHVQLELHEGLHSIAYPRLRDASLDLFIGRLDSQCSNVDLNYVPLFTADCAVVARRGHPLADCRSLDELAFADWIMSARHDGEFVAPGHVHFSHSLSITLSLLRDTDMLSIFPWPLVEVCAQREGLCTLPLRDPVGSALVGAISRSGQPLRPAAEKFLACLIDTIELEMNAPQSPYRRMLQTVEWVS